MATRVIITYYNRQALRMSIDYECLMEIIQETFPECTEISFTEMSSSEKKEAEGATDYEITAIISPFFIKSVDANGTTETRLDLTNRLKREGARLLDVAEDSRRSEVSASNQGNAPPGRGQRYVIGSKRLGRRKE